MKQFTAILTLLLLVGFTSCTNEDDLEEIFVGKTWYMNGATINGKKLNNEIKNFYTQDGDAAYYISFASNTFQGALSAGVTFSGTWSADGKNQTISLNVTNKPETSSPFDAQIFHIISTAAEYSSGADFIQLNADSHNSVVFGDSRTKVYN